MAGDYNAAPLFLSPSVADPGVGARRCRRRGSARMGGSARGAPPPEATPQPLPLVFLAGSEAGRELVREQEGGSTY